MRKLLLAVNAFCRELRAKARQNYKDAKASDLTEAEQKHSKGFADAQMWAYRRVQAIMKEQGFCVCNMCVGAEMRHGIGKRLT